MPPEQAIADPEQLTSLLRQAMPSIERSGMTIESIGEAEVTIRLPYRESMLRPGNTLSGPVMFAAADSAMFVLLLARYGPELLAVTADANIRFLNKPQPADLLATATFLKQGKRLIVIEVDVVSAADGKLVAHVTGSYSRPASSTA